MENVVQLPLEQAILEDLVDKAKDWALLHGVAMRSTTMTDPDALCFAPFVLLPSPFPRKEFEKVVKIQPVLNDLMHKVANNSEFLRHALQEIIKVDDFTKRLFDIFEIITKEGRTQPLSLGLLRSDYMLHSDCGRLKQVEINSISSSFGGIGSKIVDLNRFVLQELGLHDKLKNLPKNNALAGLCNGIIKAWDLYNKESAVILFIIEDVNPFISDQRFHEFEIKKLRPNVKVIRKTLNQLVNFIKLGPNKELIIEGKFEVAVIYFRAGYESQHYPTEKEWEVRLLMELSLAIKCPTIEYHLAGSKKMQEALARPNVLEKFIEDKKTVEIVRSLFTGIYSLNFDDHGEEVLQMAVDSPERFVLKPDCEGAGCNVYGSEIRKTLLAMKTSKERLAWLLMDKITPPVTPGYMIRPGTGGKVFDLVDLVYELGIFGVIIGNEKEIFNNEQVGYILRTKLAMTNEANISGGSGAFDSPYLID